jgi:putative transposase
VLYEALLRDQPQLSLSRFAREAGVPAWTLREARKQAVRQQERDVEQQIVIEQVRTVALAHPTYGYRRVHRVLRSAASESSTFGLLGQHTVRLALGTLGINPPQPRKSRKKALPAAPETLWPAGRRIQMDATRFTLADGVCWAYLVLDVDTRAILHIHVIRSLSALSAVTALRAGIATLRAQGIQDEILIMTDGGSDFTSGVFQETCQVLGGWIRAKVSQRGGMGILERTNRTLKYEFVFREEFCSIRELRDGADRFLGWYNHVRLHAALGYACPWAKLLETAKARNAA